MSEGRVIFSPIAHSHSVAEFCDLPGTWEFWGKIDKVMLRGAKELWVLTLPGWDTSTGVQAETKWAQKYGLKIRYVEYRDD